MTHDELLGFFRSDWLREEADGLFGTVALLVHDGSEAGRMYTLDLGSGCPLRGGWSTACEGVLDVDLRDPDLAMMAHVAATLPRYSGAAASAARRLLRKLFTRRYFTTLTALTLDHPLTSNGAMLTLSGTDTILHAALVDESVAQTADGDTVSAQVLVAHTAVHAGGRWHVRPGFVGDVRRLFLLTPDAAREYMVRLRRAQKARGLTAVWQWLTFFVWYRRWRSEVSLVLGGD